MGSDINGLNLIYYSPRARGWLHLPLRRQLALLEEQHLLVVKTRLESAAARRQVLAARPGPADSDLIQLLQ